MQMTLRGDYSLRVLIYLGTHPERLVTTQEISEAYGISRHHLVRVVHALAEHGYVEMHAGRSGGMRLARRPDKIRLGDVVRDSEPNLKLVECFDPALNTCSIAPACNLKGALREALEAFLASLNRRTLADILKGGAREKLITLFGG
jgi:Rrf2 family nitric oxide-sensitive transcriptional repressor